MCCLELDNLGILFCPPNLFFKESHIAKNKVHFDLTKGLKDILAAVKIKSLRTLNISYIQNVYVSVHLCHNMNQNMI